MYMGSLNPQLYVENKADVEKWVGKGREGGPNDVLDDVLSKYSRWGEQCTSTIYLLYTTNHWELLAPLMPTKHAHPSFNAVTLDTVLKEAMKAGANRKSSLFLHVCLHEQMKTSVSLGAPFWNYHSKGADANDEHHRATCWCLMFMFFTTHQDFINECLLLLNDRQYCQGVGIPDKPRYYIPSNRFKELMLEKIK